jgi:putative heme-binding domain-containing protein
VTVRQAAIGALGRLHATDAVPAIIEAAREPALKFDAQQALASMPDPRALPLYLEGVVASNADLRSACRSALTAIREQIGDDIVSLHRQNKLPANVRRALQPVFGEAGKARDSWFAFLFDNVPGVPEPAAYADFAKKTKGNPNRGRAIFADRQGVGCIKCHAVQGEGGRIGPDLAGVGILNRRDELAKAVLDPSDRIAQSYELTSIVTIHGKVLTGMVKSETPDGLELQDAEGKITRVPLAEIDERVKSRVSLMPAGLHEGMTLEDFADIVAYLENLKEPARGVTR